MASLPAILTDKRVLLLLAAVCVVVVIRATGLSEFLSLDTLAAHRASLTGWVSANLALGALIYVAAYTAAVAFSVPGAVILTIAGGFLFGWVLGASLAVVGATIGACLVFVFARALFGKNALDRFGEQARKIAGGFRRDAFMYLLALRLTPIFPFFLVNLAPAFVGVRLPVFAGATFLGIIPATAVFSLAGAGLGEVLDRGGALSVSSVLTPGVAGGLLGLACLSLAAIPLKAWLRKRAV